MGNRNRYFYLITFKSAEGNEDIHLVDPYIMDFSAIKEICMVFMSRSDAESYRQNLPKANEEFDRMQSWVTEHLLQ